MQGSIYKLHKTPQSKIRILGGGAYEAAQGVDFPPHRHSQWELVYYRSGTVGCVMGGKQHPGQAGVVWLTPPGITHAERAITAYANYYLALDLERAKPWPDFLDDDAHGSLGRLCQQIVQELAHKTSGQKRMLELLSQQLGCLLDRVSSERVLAIPEQSVARAERWIEEKCGRPLTIREVARRVCVSESALRGYFHTVRGYSPRSHLQEVRLNKAVRLLRTSTLKLEAVAELCGYDSASHLTRCVKKIMRQTPGQIRSRSLAKL